MLYSAFKEFADPTHNAFVGGYAGPAQGPGGSERVRKNAPRWTSSAARGAAEAVAMVGLGYRLKGATAMMFILVAPEGWVKFKRALLVTATKVPRELAAQIFFYWHLRAVELGGTHMATKAGRKTRTAYESMVRHLKGAGPMRALSLPEPADTPLGLAQTMAEAARPGGPIRPFLKEGRQATGLKKWDWSGFTGVAYVCYERARRRLDNDFPEALGRPSPEVVERLIRRWVLPTAIQSAGDHYVRVRRVKGGKPSFEWVPPAEVAAGGLGVPHDAPLMGVLCDPDVMSPVQAAESMGEALHHGVCDLIVEVLVDEGLIGPGNRSGAAFAGVGVFDQCVKRRFPDARVVTVSERLPHRLRALRALNPELSDALVFTDATSTEARSAVVGMDSFSITARCDPFSKANSARDGTKQAKAILEMYQALDVVRLNRPRVVVCENVAAPEVTAPVSEILRRIQGYEWRTAVVRPDRLGWPAERERQIWVGVRVGPE